MIKLTELNEALESLLAIKRLPIKGEEKASIHIPYCIKLEPIVVGLSHKLALIEIKSESSSAIRCNQEGGHCHLTNPSFTSGQLSSSSRGFPWFEIARTQGNEAQDDMESESKKNGFW
jgi:hypothetical protein